MDNQTAKGALKLTPASTNRPRGKNHLLAIAIDEYEHCSKLNNAVLDVEKFIKILTRKYTFEDPFITKLFNENATRKRIINAFRKLAQKVKPEDNVIIYFSGHGRYDKYNGGYWIPVEAEAGEDDFPDYIKNDLIKSYLEDIKSFHTFLIADSCFSGSIFIDKSKEKFTGDRRDTEPSRWGLTSGKSEIVSDGQPGKHSPFATALLDVLTKADRAPSIMHICDRVLEKVVANAKQTPMGSPLAIKGHQGGQFVFHFRSNEKEEWELIKNSNDINDLKAFLNKHPSGEFKKEAEPKLNRLKDELKLKNANSILSVNAFIGETKFEDLKKEAEKKLHNLEDVQAWEDALIENTITGFRKYLKRFKNGNFRKEAQEKIEHKLTVQKERHERQLIEQEALKKQQEEKRLAEEAAAKKKQEEKEKEAEQLKKLEKERKRKKAEEARRKKKAEKEAAKKREEAERLKKLEKEKKRKKAFEEQQKKETEEAAAKKQLEELRRKKPTPTNPYAKNFDNTNWKLLTPPPTNKPIQEDSVLVEVIGGLLDNTTTPMYLSNVLGSFFIYFVILSINYSIRFWVYKHEILPQMGFDIPIPDIFSAYPAVFLALVFSLFFSFLTLIIYWAEEIFDAESLASIFQIILVIALLIDLIYPFFYFIYF